MQPVSGDIAPDFTISIGEESFFSLADHLGKKVLVYFYPKDDTPTCTQQACDFKAFFSQFTLENCVIIGISKDSSESHKEFSNKYHLPFYLGSDPEGFVLSKYGVLVTKSMYGRIYTGINRSTFLINQKGQIEKIWRSVKLKNHVEEVLRCLNTTI